MAHVYNQSLFFLLFPLFSNAQYDKLVIGGVDQPSVRRQVNGFGSGVKIACSTCIAYGLYSGTFESDPKLIKTVADLLTEKKVSVVFNAASIFGTLTLKNLTTQQGIYAIGSGSDEWVTNWAYGSVPGSEHVLTSVQTDYTVLVRSVVQSVLRANLTGGGTVFYGVNTDMRQSAIKLAPAHEAGGVFTKEVEEKMRGYVKDMTVGKLTTGVDHKSGDSRSSGSCKYLLWLTFGVNDDSHLMLCVVCLSCVVAWLSVRARSKRPFLIPIPTHSLISNSIYKCSAAAIERQTLFLLSFLEQPRQQRQQR